MCMMCGPLGCMVRGYLHEAGHEAAHLGHGHPPADAVLGAVPKREEGTLALLLVQPPSRVKTVRVGVVLRVTVGQEDVEHHIVVLAHHKGAQVRAVLDHTHRRHGWRKESQCLLDETFQVTHLQYLIVCCRPALQHLIHLLLQLHLSLHVLAQTVEAPEQTVGCRLVPCQIQGEDSPQYLLIRQPLQPRHPLRLPCAQHVVDSIRHGSCVPPAVLAGPLFQYVADHTADSTDGPPELTPVWQEPPEKGKGQGHSAAKAHEYCRHGRVMAGALVKAQPKCQLAYHLHGQPLEPLQPKHTAPGRLGPRVQKQVGLLQGDGVHTAQLGGTKRGLQELALPPPWVTLHDEKAALVDVLYGALECGGHAKGLHVVKHLTYDCCITHTVVVTPQAAYGVEGPTLLEALLVELVDLTPLEVPQHRPHMAQAPLATRHDGYALCRGPPPCCIDEQRHSGAAGQHHGDPHGWLGPCSARTADVCSARHVYVCMKWSRGKTN
eukprot:comp22008_c0_seq2/m.31863 comp22008_c0_seq2/g.31863  ORF comp22008_c0_seq2/g.31863 comp22008_c0_seq2/m.31863 type:complete len:492 (+) comp22008_c0_seq2:59-1534(+)